MIGCPIWVNRSLAALSMGDRYDVQSLVNGGGVKSALLSVLLKSSSSPSSHSINFDPKTFESKFSNPELMSRYCIPTSCCNRYHSIHSTRHTLPSNNNTRILQIKQAQMSSQNEGRQSPPPEEQSGAQQQDPPSNAKGVNPESNNKEESKSQIEVRSQSARRSFSNGTPLHF